jgi:hypothetical protein
MGDDPLPDEDPGKTEPNVDPLIPEEPVPEPEPLPDDQDGKDEPNVDPLVPEEPETP